MLPEADPRGRLLAEFFLSPGRLTVRVTVTGSETGEPDYDSFAWQVLDTLASSATADAGGDTFVVTLSMEAETLEPSL